jgi:hypothetical protein
MAEHKSGEAEGTQSAGIISTEIVAWESGITRLYHYEAFKPESLAATLCQFRVHCSDPTRRNAPWDCRPAFDTSCLNDPVEAQNAIEQLQALTPEKPIDPHADAVMEWNSRCAISQAFRR